jgi:predicted ArsR family transcriptional regulator
VQTTRARIVELLRGGGATVDDITNDLSLAPATVRRHLDVLLRDGLVEMRSERMPLGRPHFVFTLSEGALQDMPGRQFQLTTAVVDTILELKPRDTRGCSGSQIAALVLDRLAGQLLSHCRPAVTATQVPDRLQQAVDALASAGLDFQVSAAVDGYLVTGAGCPCTRLLTGRSECPHEVQVLTELVGLPLERTESPSARHHRSFLVRSSVQGVL